MISKKLLATLVAVLLAAPALAVAKPIQEGPVAETVVEGHTVFTVIEQRLEDKERAAAVAVLVREKDVRDFPGVLWFNDQYLVNPVSAEAVRYPCGGAVLAVNSGDPDPTFLANDEIASIVYQESYEVTDPNDHTWIIDKYLAVVGAAVDVPTGITNFNLGGGGDAELSNHNTHTDPRVGAVFPVWAVNIKGSSIFTPDDGVSNCPPFQDLPAAGFYEPTNPLVNGGASYCYNGEVAPAGQLPGSGCPDLLNEPTRLYNAVLFMYFGDFGLSDDGDRAHGPTVDDTNGCQVGTEWTCPNGDDDKEGNSHPFNPDAGAHNVAHAHDTSFIDLYASNFRPAEPALREFVLVDTIGSGAPFH